MSTNTIHKAFWNETLIAESDKCINVEGNWYFPPGSIKKEYFQESPHTSICSWKGLCNYYHIIVNNKKNENACWVYKNPKPAAQNIAGYYAFWKGINVT
jgi:uncharacterized protein (DUF427 family)